MRSWFAASRKIGYGLDSGVDMGPVISLESRQRIEGLIAHGVSDGAHAVVFASEQ
jgi:malonate-semialdehyde dehydrogenase (acetylating)/methylmalonate-semialdehyde dehydrogenase